MDNQVKIVDDKRKNHGRQKISDGSTGYRSKENVKIEAATQTFATITLQNYLE